ncbi:MAG: DUF4348 domain-containing protein [Clostridium sp.]|nr:DUF4348 domain-containing protein [Clostridium sp.]
MKKIVMFLLPALMAGACSNSHREESKVVPAENTDTLPAGADTLDELKDEWPMEQAEEEQFPQSVDELFDDFAFEFARNEQFQLERVHFPLPLIRQDGDTALIGKRDWKQTDLFLKQDFYTVIFNSHSQMDLEKSTNCEHVTVEWLYLTEEYSRNYNFQRTNGTWRLNDIHDIPFSGTVLYDFLRFYRNFAADSVYQNQHIATPLRYTTEDPDDDMQMLEGTLDADQWPDFRPELPADIITNVCYGQSYRNRHKMVLLKRGISNGLLDILTFDKSDGQWRLAAYEN